MNSALTLDHREKQWVDLGIHTEACMTRPETCGAAGGAISLWMNLNECSGSKKGFISSRRSRDYTGISGFCNSYRIK